LNKKKILITGFPHTGTSILKSKLGECENVYEWAYEAPIVNLNMINVSGDKEFILIKYPQIPVEIRANHLMKVSRDSIYQDYNIIFIIRNPWNVFTSIVKSGYNPIKKIETHLDNEYHVQVTEYLAACEKFLNARNNKEDYPNIYTIKYEELFLNNFENVFNIMNSIGLKYDGDIFNVRTKDYIHWQGESYKNIDENLLDYKKNKFEYRTWQINQPFQNMNGDVDIPDELSDILENSPIIKELGYTDPRKIK
jgi:hypothetical protein